VALATQADVVARLGRPLSEAEQARTDPGLLDEASALVTGYLGGDPTGTDGVPATVAIVVSRMVARVLSQDSGDFATAETNTAGPFSQTRQFTPGSTSGAPWLSAADKTMLKPFRVAGDAFSIDTAPRGSVHSEICSANNYVNLPYWHAYCTCGADIAGEPIYEGPWP